MTTEEEVRCLWSWVVAMVLWLVALTAAVAHLYTK